MTIKSILSEDIRSLIQQLRRSQEAIESDWTSVMIKQQNLQDSWKDSQRNQFEAIFEDLHRTCNELGRQQEEYIQLLEKLIHKVENAIDEGPIDIS